MQEIIDETPLIQETIKFGSNAPLYEALAGFFTVRTELLRELEKDTSRESVKSELLLLEDLMGRVIVFAGEWAGVHSVAGKLLLRGNIDSRGEVLRLAAPIFDRVDANLYPPKDVPLIGIAGPIASGKGEIGDIIHSAYDSMHLPLSDRLREIAVTKGEFSAPERSTLRKINDEMKPRFGNPVFVRATLQIARRFAGIYQQDITTLDGFRSKEEALMFKDHGGTLIGIDASPDVRFHRLLLRKRDADDFGREKFDESDRIEREWIAPVLSIADVVIHNEGTQSELRDRVLDYVSALLPTVKRK